MPLVRITYMSGDWLKMLPALYALGGRLPEPWLSCPADETLRRLRWRLQFTQAELAGKAGMPQVQISRLEGGADALLSTWRRLFDGMGFDLALLPVPRLPPGKIEEAAQKGRPAGWRRRERFKPRSRKKAAGSGAGHITDGMVLSAQKGP